MNKGKIMIAVVLGLFLVLTVGIVLANVIPNACHCFGACYYCDTESGKCKTYDGPGACFCTNNPCHLNEHFLCCKAH
jgi:hypothetical protein